MSRLSEFLARIGTARLPSARPEVRAPQLDATDLVSLFIRRLEEVDGVVHRTDPVEVVAGLARRLGTDRYLSWDPDRLPVPGLVAELETLGIERHTGPGREEVPLGVTGADAGLAESGTVVLIAGPGRPRHPSLLPEVHVALLRVDLLHRSLTHWMLEHPQALSEGSGLIMITGPSRTADIEQQLNLGVHGPREVHVVLVGA
ncbi:MAG: hypothetical protein KatS3mg011_0466 [Acidimicrobiia bacterium]|nr:MAG: hypothetical protein KatS3mg011_0466 [Acidimicrobiia bacterium]